MAPSALYNAGTTQRPSWTAVNRSKVGGIAKRQLFGRTPSARPILIKEGRGHSYFTDDGSEIYDASGGAAVSILAKNDPRPINAAYEVRLKGLSYVPNLNFEAKIVDNLAQKLLDFAGGKLKQAVFYCSGSEAAEAALKLSIQYQTKVKSSPEPSRTIVLSRDFSYHGATIAALAVSGHEARKAMFEAVLPQNRRAIPACHPYRNRKSGQSDEEYVKWHKEQVIATIETAGKDKVAALIIEPVVGAALGCAPAVPGYLKAMREVCDQYGVILIFDEIMCGLGRTGYMHAWQSVDGVAPDIQLVGKALASGFEPISGMLVGPKIVDAFATSNAVFNHGHTFQNSPAAAAAALEVLRIVEDEKLLENVREMGPLIQKMLKTRLSKHRYVGDIRGPKEGSFCGIEFVKDKTTKQPFELSEMIAMRVHQKGLQKPYGIFIYPGTGSADGLRGDHEIIAPAYCITTAEACFIVQRVCRLIEDFFDEYDRAQVSTAHKE